MDITPRPTRPRHEDRLSTMVHAFLAEGTGAGVGLLGVLDAIGLLDDELGGDAVAPEQRSDESSSMSWWVRRRR